jgi:signal transduction histidine kinase/ActR/RegA family two-component response regulator/HPt (histidine-containing phosphotransfer) domain-containing protein
MTNAPTVRISIDDVASVFPFHVAFDGSLTIVQIGPSLAKLAPGITVGHPLAEHFTIESPAQAEFSTLRAHQSTLVVLRIIEKNVLVRGQLLRPDDRSTLFLCSPWVTSTFELQRLGLSLSDFALHDPMSDLLQVLQAQDSTLSDVRKLVSKLSAQRKEQRAATGRMSALYEVTRILAGGASLDSVAERVLAQVAEIVRYPVAAIWLHDSSTQHVVLQSGSDIDGALQLKQLLLEFPPDLTTGIWISTANPVVKRLEPTASCGGRCFEAVALGFPFAYQVQIDGASGSLGAIELYGTTVPGYERSLLDTLSELGTRIGQFIDKTRADAALRESIKVAAAAAAAKSQFLARMSHEIRTPINGVLGMIELVLGTPLQPEQKTQLSIARSSGELLLGLVNDVLDFSKIEAGFLEISSLPFDLHACLQRVRDLFEARVSAKHLMLGLWIHTEVPVMVRGDELRLSQVLVNLVANAVKFTKEGMIDIEVRASDATAGEAALEIVVRDTGIGIPESRSEAIFSAFTQAETNTAREFGGTGLGLAICKQLVELMGGELTVSSTVGKGSCFRFSLRVGREMPVACGRSDPEEAPKQGPLRILVVEDNEINQAVARGLLERDGHIVEIADRMESAISRGCDGVFDVILMDIQLPDGDGLTATTAIRAHGRRVGRRTVPIIGLSAQAVSGDRERAMAVGMNDYLTKPVRPAQLTSALARFAVAKNLAVPGQHRAIAKIGRAEPATDLYPCSAVPCTGSDGAELHTVQSQESPRWSHDDQARFASKVLEYEDLGEMVFSLALALAQGAPPRLRELEAKVAARDYAAVAFVAHSLVGSSGTIGFSLIETSARAIEQLANGASEDLIPKIDAELLTLGSAIQSLISFVASDVFLGHRAQAQLRSGSVSV